MFDKYSNRAVLLIYILINKLYIPLSNYFELKFLLHCTYNCKYWKWYQNCDQLLAYCYQVKLTLLKLMMSSSLLMVRGCSLYKFVIVVVWCSGFVSCE